MLTPELKAKITWNCRRGMLELDLMLNRFVKDQLDGLDNSQITSLQALLESPDPDMFAWLMGVEQPQDQGLRNIVEYIRSCDSIK